MQASRIRWSLLLGLKISSSRWRMVDTVTSRFLQIPSRTSAAFSLARLFSTPTFHPAAQSPLMSNVRKFEGADDRAALIALYLGTGGDEWFQKMGWCTDAPLSQWQGVSVDDQGRVIELNLSNNNLVGGIPRELGSLHNLQILDLSDNRLTGGILKELGSLDKLRILHLSDNKLTGAIPVEFGALESLQDCNLASNRLRDGIPRELGSLHNLQILDLSRNRLTDGIPKELSSLHNLQILDLSRNRLTGGIPRELGSLTKLLRILDLRNNKLTGAVPAQLAKLHNLWELSLAGNNFSDPLPSLKQLKDLFVALDGVVSSEEEPPVHNDATGRLQPPQFHKAANARVRVEPVGKVTASSAESRVYPGTTYRWEPRLFGQGARAEDGVELVSKATARTAGFEGDVIAWSFGATAGVIGCPDFELEVPDLGREVPALIGQSPSAAEMIDREFCLLHPVITCLAGSGEIFNPPLLLRFPVGDIESMESGSESERSDGAEESFYTYLKSRYSVVKREENRSTWVPISAEIVQMDNGVFVLEAQVSHFTDYALRQTVEVGQGQVKFVDIKKLPHESRRNAFLFVNQGDKPIVVYYWPHHTRQYWISRVRASLGFESFGISGEVDRKILNALRNGVESEVVYSLGRPVVLETSGIKSLEVAWATLEEHDGHRLVNVWGKKTMGHKKAMVIGRLQDKVHAAVQDLQIVNGEHVGNNVRATLEN